MTNNATSLSIHKSVTVGLSQQRAFDLFTEEMTSWWPLQQYSVCDDESASIVFEGRVGGRVYEVADKCEGEWGRVIRWNAPESFVMSWLPNPDSPAATEVTVSFVPLSAEETQVDLVHSGWELYGDAAASARDSYETGWPGVLASYEGASRTG